MRPLLWPALGAMCVGLCASSASAQEAQQRAAPPQLPAQQQPAPKLLANPMAQMQQKAMPLGALAVERRLHPHEVESSSFLWNSWNEFQENYHPIYAFDGDRKTAWVEGADGNGEGEWIKAHVTPMEGATSVRLRLRNGYQKSRGLYKANSRARKLTVKLHPTGHTEEVLLTDAEGWQEVKVLQPEGPLNAIELKLEKVYPGKKYTDTCLSDAEIFVTAITRESPAAEQAHFKRIKKWKAARLKAARLFKKGEKGHVPLAPQYALQKAEGFAPSSPDDAGCKWNETDCQMRHLVKALGEAAGEDAELTALVVIARQSLDSLPGQKKADGGWRLAQVVPRDKRPLPRLDNLRPPDLWEVYEGGNIYVNDKDVVHGHMETPLTNRVGDLHADQLAVFDLKSKVTLDAHMRLKNDRCKGNRDGVSKTYTWARQTPASGETKARVTAVFAVQCGGVETRGGAERVEAPQLLVYGPKGRLGLAVGANYAVRYQWRDQGDAPVLTSATRLSAWESGVKLVESSNVAAQ